MSRCAGSKPDGTPCERIVKASQTYCFSHDPARKEERKRNASKAGRGGGSVETKALKKQLQDLAADVLAGKVERAAAVVVNQILNTQLRAIEVERKIREQEEIEERLAELERGGARWEA